MKVPLLVLSHLVVLGLAYWVGHQIESSEAAGVAESEQERSRRHRVSHKEDGDLLLSFLPQSAGGTESRYDQLKDTLAVAGDHEKALLALISRLPNFYAPKSGSEAEVIAKFKVRVLHWLRDDRDACLDFLSENLPPLGNIKSHPLMTSVLVDYAMECDFDEIAPWLSTRNQLALESLMKQQLKSGAGLEIFGVLGTANTRLINRLNQNLMPYVPFSDREKVLEICLSAKGQWYWVRGFINNPAHPQSEMMAWINELNNSDKLDKKTKAALSRTVANWIEGAESISHEERIAALDKWGHPSKEPYRSLAIKDVQSLLEEGRDWAYEFRHGRVSAEEVWQNLSAQLPAMNEEGKKGALSHLFHTLAEENPKKSFVLLDGFPEEERRDLLFNSSWRSFGNMHPQALLDYTQSLPPAENEEEKYLRIKGWEWKSRHLLSRLGDDYVQWVQQMPEGPDKTEALRGLVWATREVNPAQAEILRKKIYPNP